MNPLIQKNKNVVVILGVVVLSIFAAKMAYDVSMNKVVKIKEDIRLEQEKGEALERIVKANEAVKKMKERGWVAVDFASVVKRVQDLAQKFDIKVLDLTPGQRKEETHVVLLPFFMRAEGRFRDLVNFLKALETDPRLMRIGFVSLSPENSAFDAPVSEEGTLLAISLSGAAYHFK